MLSADIILVNPSNKKQVYGKLSEALTAIEPPLWTSLLAGYIREKGFSVKIVDADIEGWEPQETADEILRFKPILVGIGAVGTNPSASSTPKMAAVRSVSALLREKSPETKTVIYGIHPSGLPERTLKEEPIDFLCRGEGFYPITELLEAIKSGKKEDFNIKGIWYRKGNEIVDNGWADVIKNLDELPFAAWDLLPMGKYRAHNWHCFGNLEGRSPYGIIYTSLGCPFNCTYCNIHALYGGKPGIRYRSPKRALEEIDFLVKTYKVKNFKILDELFVMGGKRIEEICDLLIERNYGLNIWAYARIDTVNEKILKKLKAAGINWLCYGIEAGSQDVRSGVAKGRFSNEMIRNTCKMTHDIGIYILGNFMFGLPDDTMETMQQTFELAKELNCEYSNFYTIMAYPGSQLYHDAINEGLTMPDSWLGFSQFSKETVPLPTKYVSSEDVLRFRDNAFAEYYSSERYQKMIKEKFGDKTLEHVKKMLTGKLPRKILSESLKI